MRNIFDQYSQPENRVTHALMTALDEDRQLLGLFLRELVGVKPPTKAEALSVLEQQFPGEAEPREEDLERRGIPDGWIFDENGWCVFIESKVTAPLTAAQIASHWRTAERRGFSSIHAVAIVPRVTEIVSPDLRILEWRTVYAWLRKHRQAHPWAAKAGGYLEIAEARLIETGRFVEGTLTMFAGFPFGQGDPYTYLEAKRVLGLAMQELRDNTALQKLGMNPKLPGRPAITGSKDRRVWDFLSLATTDGTPFTDSPHLTLGVHDDAVETMVTLPHKINRKARRAIAGLGEVGFRELVADILANMKPLIAEHAGVVPWCRGTALPVTASTAFR